MDTKRISKGLLIYIGIQALLVGGGTSRHYLFSQGKQAIKRTETGNYCEIALPYGAISRIPGHYPAGPICGDTREFKVFTVGTTTGSTTSGDSTIMQIPV